MRRTLCFILISLLFGCTYTPKWDTTERLMATSAVMLTAIDCIQTQTIAQYPEQYYERNPILGSHPSTTNVMIYFSITPLLALIVADQLNHASRKAWLSLWTGMELYTILHNERLGL